MNRPSNIGPVMMAGVLHAAALWVPLQFQDPEPQPPPVKVALQKPEPPPPEPEPPEPEPEPPPPEPEPPPPEPPPKPKPKPKPDLEPPPPEPPPPEPPPPEPAPPPPPAPPPVTTAANAPVGTPKVRNEPRRAPTKPPDMQGYGRGVHGSLMRHRRYPAAARRLGMEGTVKVKFTIDRRGRLVGKPHIVRSSGHEILDVEALRTVRESAPFEALPEAFERDTATVTLPIKFSLK